MAFTISENKKYMGVPLDSVYVRLHIQIGILGSVIVKPIIYANESTYNENNQDYLKMWVVPLEKQLEILPELEDGVEAPKKKPKPKYETITETKDICTAVFDFGKVESFKKLIPEVTKLAIKELLDIGFIKDNKNVTIN